MKTPPTTTPGERLAAALEMEFPEERLAEALSQLAVATSTTRSGIVEPDNRVRLAAIQLALEHRFGKATQRAEIRTQAVPTNEAMLEMLSKSGEARRAFRDYIQLAEVKAATVDV